jgi:hypothetical protein
MTTPPPPAVTPRLKLGLSAEQVARRREYIGGSDAGKIASGDWLPLWQEKTGRVPAEDLSRVLVVQMGSHTEELNRHWYEQETGRRVTDEQEFAIHPEFGFLRAHLDGRTTTAAGRPAVFEAKHCGGFENMDTILARYQAQLHHNMLCAGIEHAVLSVFLGASKWEVVEVEFDWIFAGKLLEKERAFWCHVREDTAPPHEEPLRVPSPDKWRDVCLTGNNAWASHAADWIEHRDGAKRFDRAAKELKALVEPDVGFAYGHGIEIRRSKNGALTVKESNHA